MGIVAIFVFLLPLIAGGLLIIFSRKRNKSYPSCGKCGYDVSGSVGTVTRCPECGIDFIQAGITPPGSKYNPFMLAGGIVLIVLSLGCVGSLVIAGMTRVQLQTIPQTFQPGAPTPPSPPSPPGIDPTIKSEDEAEPSSPP